MMAVKRKLAFGDATTTGLEGPDFFAARRHRFVVSAVLSGFVACCLVLIGPGGRSSAAEEPDPQIVAMVVELLADKDPQMRALGLQQVREGLEGEAATKMFAALLPKLSPEGQAALIDALASRTDKAARPAVLAMLESDDQRVQASALRSLGTLGEAGDVPRLVKALAAADGPKSAARASLVQLPGAEVSTAIASELKTAAAEARVELLAMLVERSASNAVDEILPLTAAAEARVRAAATAALMRLAGPQHVDAMVGLLLKTADAAEREAMEKAIMFACARQEDTEKRAEPLLAVFEKLPEADQRALQSALGRVGGQKVLAIVEEAIRDRDAALRDLGVRALCNWPDASVADRLLELAQKADEPDHRIRALRASMRVAVLADRRSDADRLALLRRAMTIATRDEDRALAIDRAKAVRTIESLRFAVAYLDDAKLAQQACATVVELAHHKGLREPNKPEFDAALDRVIAICRDAKLIDRAKRYKAGQTLG
jgi:HEAT repeat protein